jgi:hypothetical protein
MASRVTKLHTNGLFPLESFDVCPQGVPENSSRTKRNEHIYMGQSNEGNASDGSGIVYP